MTKARLLGAVLGLLAVLGPPAVLWSDTILALVPGWRPVGNIEHLGCALLTLWLAIATALLASVRGRMVILRRGLELFCASVIVCFGLVLAECYAVSLLAKLQPDKPFHSRGVNLRLLFDPVPGTMPGLDGPAYYTTDPQGLRPAAAANMRNARRLVCVGGSSTECTYLDDAETWPVLLSRELTRRGGGDELWVDSMGISGYSTLEHGQLLCGRGLPSEIQGVILQTGINDLWRYLANEDEEMDLRRFADKAPEFRPIIAPEEVHKPIWTRSRIIEFYHTVQRSRSASTLADVTMVESPGGSEYNIRRERRAKARITESLPDLVRGLAHYEERIRRIIACCRDRGLYVAFTTQPVLWDTALPAEVAARCWFGWLPDGSYLDLGVLRQAMDAYNRRLLDLCSEEGIPCADLGEMNGHPEFFYDDCHFTEEGATVVARRVADTLESRLPGN